MDIDIEQCRENDKIKDIISKSGLSIKHIKLLLRVSDVIYINAINYNVQVSDDLVTILLLSSKPENKMGLFNITSLAIVLNRIKDIERDYEEMETWCQIENDVMKVELKIQTT
ncbi:MAG: hypothetical protein LUQ24_03005 [Methanobacterium sp.]|nr:hypothetical protein [Methanobacterium sp.]